MTQEEASTLFEQKIVHSCAPTLAGIKPSSMFVVRFEEPCACARKCSHCRCRSMQKAAFVYALERARDQLAQQNVQVQMLAFHAESTLLLVYRADLLASVLCQPCTRAFLTLLGYPLESPEQCVAELARRVNVCEGLDGLRKRETFPHEVGFFLGYPYNDVVSFMLGGRQCACVGCWKAYGNAEHAQRCFDAFKRCTRQMEAAHAQGATLAQLTQTAA